jgi:ribose transport system ATP-binding protein
VTDQAGSDSAERSPGAIAPSLPILVAKGITKRYGGTLALDSASIAVLPAEVHGLLGQNGSGKSTLIKILAGVVTPEEGELAILDQQLTFPLPFGEAHRRGLRFVHQNLGLIPSLTVAENLFIDRLALWRRNAYIKWGAFFDEADAILHQYGLDVDPRAPLHTLPLIERSLLAIIRAVAAKAGASSSSAQLIVLDEPTVFLPRDDVGRVFAMIRDLVSRGIGVLFVSHRMDEVRDHTDRVTVLRDGRNVGTVETNSISDDELVHMIVGDHTAKRARAVEELAAKSEGDVALKVSNLSTRSLREIDLTVLPGEILGITGLAGAGYEEVLYAAFGASRGVSGWLELGSSRLDVRDLTPHRAMELGIALIPAERLLHGIASRATVEENETITVVDSQFKRLFLRRSGLNAVAARLTAQLGIQPPDYQMQTDQLSGGNQQKVLLAKWLVRRPRVLLLHEPTQGVDVGARVDITTFIRQMAGLGTIVICGSAEYEQLADLCTKVAIIGDGRISRVLEGEDVTRENILSECLRTSSKARAAEIGTPTK